MKRLFPTSVFTKLLLAVLLPISCLAVVLSVYAANARLDDLDKAFGERGEANAQQMASSALLGLFTADEQLLQSAAERHLLRDPELVEVVVHDREGAVVARATRKMTEPDSSSLSSFSAYVEQPSMQFELGSPVFASASIGRVAVTFSNLAADDAARAIVRNTALISLIAVAFAGMLAIAIARQIVRPVMRLRHAVRRLREGDLDVRVAETSSGEIGDLEAGFNSMADAVSSSADELQKEVEQATSDLQQTMDALEIRNIQLDIARKRAQEANAAKSVFLANMSHEIRTPMNGVLGFANLLRKSQLDDSQRGYVQTLLDSASQLMSSINDILDFSKMEAGKLSLEHQAFSLHEAVEESVQLFSAQARNKGIALSMKRDDDVPDAVKGDALRLRQIINNLIGNAIKFTDQGEVSVHLSMRSRTGDEVWVVLGVRDTGIGIPGDVMQKLFQPFSQGAPSTTRLYGGTGLGLSICRRLAEAMGGSINGVSTEGEGAEFTVTLPLEIADASPVEAKSGRSDWPGPDWLTGRLFLVADDNPINLQLVEALLGGYGAQIVRACNGDEAVSIALERPVDVAFIDIHMPQLDGFSAAERIAEQKPALPLVALTADMTMVQRIAERERPFVECLTKPLDDDLLVAVIAKALQLPSRRDPEMPLVAAAPDPNAAIRDRERAIAQAAGSADIADALFKDFVDALPEALAQIDAAYRARDWAPLWAAAHRLQGAAATCSLPALHDALAQLARAAKHEQLIEIAPAVDSLEHEARRLVQLAQSTESTPTERRTESH